MACLLMGLVLCRQSLPPSLKQQLFNLEVVCGDAQERLESMQYANPGLELQF